MALRKRPRRPLSSPRRNRRSVLPLLESLEDRLVLSLGVPALAYPIPGGSGAAAVLSPESGLVPFPLAHGGTAWLLAPGSTGSQPPAGPGSSQGTTAPTPLDSGAMLADLPVSSPWISAGDLQFNGPAGYLPQQIQTAYGLSNGSGFNDNIAFGAIKGDGAGQTIGLFEVGSNPDFVDTSDPNYGTSALAVFDKTFGLPDPPSLTFYDQYGNPITPSNPAPGGGDGFEIALDIEWAHAMAPGASIDVINVVPNAGELSYAEAIPQGMATLAGLPGVSVVSVSYGAFLDGFYGGEFVGFEQQLDSTILDPAIPT
jgi:hypothetical protein